LLDCAMEILFVFFLIGAVVSGRWHDDCFFVLHDLGNLARQAKLRLPCVFKMWV
jgi:hypothetical protein